MTRISAQSEYMLPFAPPLVLETALVAVRCPTHNIGMVQRPKERQTREQLWCGTWWDCPAHKCGCSTLFESHELRKQLSEQRARVTKAKGR